jgi:hypothetical protein
MDAANPIPPGLCQCGCGRKTATVQTTARKFGRVKGEPSRYIRGHAAKNRGAAYEEMDCGFETPCWVWLWTTDPQGYGRLVKTLAHVLVWERTNGPVPDGLELDHLCRVRACVNPAHLEPVTHAENVRRGRRAKLTVASVRQIRTTPGTAIALAEKFGVSVQTVYSIRQRRSWKDVA